MSFCQECFFSSDDLEAGELTEDFDRCPDCGGEFIDGFEPDDFEIIEQEEA